MKKILFTNYSLMHYAGSEIDTITIAHYFLKQGYSVTIFTLEYGYPILEKIDSKIKIIDYDSTDKLEDFYDIIWAHHFPLLDYILLNKKIKANYIHYVSLSSYMPHEALPVYYKDLSLVSVLSKECLNVLKSEGYDISKINLLPNYATEEYFTNTINRVKLKKIAIVSNHVPQELLDFKEIALKNNYSVDIYGIGYNYILINQDILNKYDLIISIGKTVNYAIALKIPVYCYDRFGGDLYITSDNIEESYNYIFSGKYLAKKLTGKEIYNDIINNYSKVLSQLDDLQKFAYNNFNLDNLLNKTINNLTIKKKFNLDEFLIINKSLIKNNSLFVEEIGKKNSILKLYSENIDLYQIYFDIGNNFNEKDSIINNYIREKNHIYKSTIIIPKNYNEIRFDFTNKPFMYVKSIKINNKEYKSFNKNNLIAYKKGFVSLNDDPSIIINKKYLKTNKLYISVEMEQLNSTNVINELLALAREEEKIIQKAIDEKEYKNKKFINRVKRKIKKIIKK